MNFFEAQEFFKKMYPDKLITFEFDDKCIAQIECIYTDGDIHMINHIEYRQVKCTPQGMPSTYIPIQPHRMMISAEEMKKKISSSNIFIHPDEVKNLKLIQSSKDPSFDIKLMELSYLSGLSKDEILSKMS